MRIVGIELRLIAEHARHAVALRVWSTDDAQMPATAWEFSLPATRSITQHCNTYGRQRTLVRGAAPTVRPVGYSGRVDSN